MREVDTANLRFYMEKAGFRTIGDLSSASGINRNTLAGVINGKILPSSNIMSKLIETLQIPIAEAGPIFFSEKLA